MSTLADKPPQKIALRPASEVMRLARMGAFHQTRLSFMRQLTRRMAAEAWTFERPVFEIDARGVGHALYQVETGARTYTLVAFAHDLPKEARSDRVIAEAWDATFTLFDGVPTEADITRLRANVPLQEAGRISARELTLLRANRSVRAWTLVQEALAAGQQPDPAALAKVGYLMRTTAVYGSGKFGAADRSTYAERPEFSAPFQAEMLSVYLTRIFVRDLVEHMARQAGGARATRLDPQIAQGLGIGNSTGLGMAPFLINHPVLLHNWIQARETAIARVCALPRATPAAQALFLRLLDASVEMAADWHSNHPAQAQKNIGLRQDLARTAAWLGTGPLSGADPFARLMAWARAHLDLEAQECLASLMLEPYPELCDPLCAQMSDQTEGYVPIDGRQTIGALRASLTDTYGELLTRDYTAPEECARAWYVSAEKLEPRLGERLHEPIEPFEQPLDCARAAAALFTATARWHPRAPVAELLVHEPQHRVAVRRAQIAADAPYAEIRDNTIASNLMPIDMLRAKLSFFGATRFDPRSDRWVRITMFQGAPFPEDLCPGSADFWIYSPRPRAADAREPAHHSAPTEAPA